MIRPNHLSTNSFNNINGKRSFDPRSYFALAMPTSLSNTAWHSLIFNNGQRHTGFCSLAAGNAFQNKQYPVAASFLQSALRIDPHDNYAVDFAASTYFLMGNLDAALK